MPDPRRLFKRVLFRSPRRSILIVTVSIVGVLFLTRVGAEALSEFALRQAKAGRYDLAIVVAKVASKLTNSPQAYSRLGDVYLEAQQYEQAAEEYQETLLRDLRYPGARYKRARMLFALGHFPRAVAEATQELERDPLHIKAKYIRGLAYSYTGNWEAAIQDFTDLLQVNAEWPWTNIDLSWAYLAKGNYVEAESLLRQTLENSPDNAWALNNLGLALMNQGRYDEAMQAFSQALGSVETMTAQQFVSAYPLRKTWQFPEGKERLKQGILFNTAVLYERRGEHDLALKTYEQVLSLDEKFSEEHNIRQVGREELQRRIHDLATKRKP